MTNQLIVFLFVVLSTSAFGQTHVSWEFTYDSEAEQVVAQTHIDEGWHLYSQYIVNDFGPIPTAFQFEASEDYRLIGITQEEEPIKEYDPNFEGEMHFFKDSTTFVQQVVVTATTKIKGTVTYMVCNDSMCMPPVDLEFTIEVENEKINN